MKRTGRLRVKPRKGWAAVKKLVLQRAGGRCEANSDAHFVMADDVHHVVKRSQGGPDDPALNLIALCRTCHDWTDAPYNGPKGRLVIRPLGRGKYECLEVRARDKQDARDVLEAWDKAKGLNGRT